MMKYNLLDFLKTRCFLAAMDLERWRDQDTQYNEHMAYRLGEDLLLSIRNETNWYQINDHTTISSDPKFRNGDLIVGFCTPDLPKIWVNKPGKRAKLWRILGEIRSNNALKRRGMWLKNDDRVAEQPILRPITPIKLQLGISHPSSMGIASRQILEGEYYYDIQQDNLIIVREYVNHVIWFGETVDELTRRGNQFRLGQR